jgi:SWI/SNF-related matrix-associated actin-dependent regulator of chromatin subfamily A member 5
MARIREAEEKAEKLKKADNLIKLKVTAYRYPMQEMLLSYSQTKGKIYSEEEDRYIICRLAHYGLFADDLYEKIKKDINEFPVFRFDWFLRSRTPVEIGRRCNTLISMITKESEGRKDDEDDEDEVVEAPPPPPKKGPKGKVRSSGFMGTCYCYAKFSNDEQKRAIDEVQKESRSSTPASNSAAKKSHKKKKT